MLVGLVAVYCVKCLLLFIICYLLCYYYYIYYYCLLFIVLNGYNYVVYYDLYGNKLKGEFHPFS